MIIKEYESQGSCKVLQIEIAAEGLVLGGAGFAILIHKAEGVDEARLGGGGFAESYHHAFGRFGIPCVHACYMNRCEAAIGRYMEHWLLGFDG